MSGPTTGRLDPARFRLAISYVLTAGVTVSAILVGAGLLGAWLFGWNASLLPGGAAAVPPRDPTDFSNLLGDLLALRPIALAQAGLLVLLATPVLRVVASVVGFALEGDRLYVAVSATVLAILLVSLFFLH